MQFSNLEMTFLKVTQTLNMEKDTPVEEFPLFKVNFEKKFGFKDFSS